MPKLFGTEAIRIMSSLCAQARINRLQLEVYEYNEAAIRCYLKCGFQEEGRLRERHFIQGKYWDVICMAVLRSDYDLIKAKNNRIRELLNSPWNCRKKTATASKIYMYLVLADGLFSHKLAYVAHS